MHRRSFLKHLVLPVAISATGLKLSGNKNEYVFGQTIQGYLHKVHNRTSEPIIITADKETATPETVVAPGEWYELKPIRLAEIWDHSRTQRLPVDLIDVLPSAA